jgi:hypothetical protein
MHNPAFPAPPEDLLSQLIHLLDALRAAAAAEVALVLGPAAPAIAGWPE